MPWFGVVEIDQPSGTVTFLFSDIEGSTPLWDQHHDDMETATARHDAILQGVIEARGGYVFTTAGDEFAASFSRAADAIEAAVEIQSALAAEPFSATTPIRVRMGLHTGDAVERDGDYFGPAVIRAARLMGMAHGGQILLSGPTADIALASVPGGSTIKPRGEVQLKGLGRAERVSELCHPGSDREYPEFAPSGRTRGRLPRFTDELIGRVADIDRVVTLLEDAPLVTLVGPGGVGKTRLSIEVGDQLLDRYPDGSWLVELASVTKADSVDQVLAEVLGVQEVGDRTLTASIVGALGGRQLLLILDNCEHVVDAVVDLVEALLVGCQGVAILASSREALGLRGERVCPVDPLALPEVGQAAADSAAVQLFVERWSASDPTAMIDDGTIATVAEICKRLDGMPLAIELAAARVRGLGIESLAERLDGALRLLRSNRGEDRHRTLRAVVSWSFDRLEPHLRDLLCRAGVFAGGFTLDSAETVLAFGGLDELDVADGVAELVDKSMIQVLDTPLGKRHRLLETMRQFGNEHIRVEDRAVVERRFTESMANLAASIDIGLSGPDPRSWFDKGAAEFDNFREACRLGLEHGWHEQTATILLSLTEFAMRRIVGEVFVLMAELGRRLPAGHELELRVMAAAVFNAHTRGDTALAEQFFARFESVESATPDQIEPEVLAQFGTAYWMLGRTDRAIDLQRTALDRFETEGKMHRAAFTLSTLSMAQDAVDREEARRSAERAVALGESLDAPNVLCSGLLSLTGVQAHHDHATARVTAARLVTTAQHAGALWFEATGTRLEGHIASRAGDLNESSEIFAKALDLNGVGDFGELLWYTVLNVVEHLDRAGLYEDAALALGAFSRAPGASRDQLVTRAVDRLAERLRNDLVGGVYDEWFERGTELATGELLIHLDGVLRKHPRDVKRAHR